MSRLTEIMDELNEMSSFDYFIKQAQKETYMLSDCCGELPFSELSDDNTGRCSFCFENSSFYESEEL
jgi:hypothetical protein